MPRDLYLFPGYPTEEDAQRMVAIARAHGQDASYGFSTRTALWHVITSTRQSHAPDRTGG